ncbi:glycosyltransferase [Kaistella sp. G5-32]|uniref:Glycosyltransferase n=1 Tax=Kaistella gelatinilytica TaxID=2787636 RepID=A0ABS0FC17_9FLAO|nr:glycosyltransferase [Kaistella gelatinilytica]MBF8457249.1 glycosyltransferase [Kaistella gelatinilytica]
MKILHVINSLATGGAEKLVVDTLPLYAEHGIEIDLLLLNGTEYPFFKELASLKCCGIFTLGMGSVYNPLHVLKIIPFLKNYDAVHIHLFPVQYWVVLAKIFSRSKTKLIFTEHSTSNRRIQGNVFMRFTDVIFYRQYNKIICITAKIQEILQYYTKLDNKKFVVIQNGVDLSKISQAIPTDKRLLPNDYTDNNLYLIQVSSFQEPKDQKTLIRAMTLLPNHYQLILVGVGPLKKECEDLAANLGLKNRVSFLGTRMDVAALLKMVDIIILSSKYEGLSLSSIEGMASGKPFVASDVPGLKEVVSGAGILFPVGDEKKLAKEILHLSNDPDHYAATVEKCLARAKEYDISKMVAEHINLYEEILRQQ